MNITSPVSVVDELERYEPEQYVAFRSASKGTFLNLYSVSKGKRWLCLAETGREVELLAHVYSRRDSHPNLSRDFQPHPLRLSEALDYCRSRNAVGAIYAGIRFPLTGEVIPL